LWNEAFFSAPQLKRHPLGSPFLCGANIMRSVPVVLALLLVGCASQHGVPSLTTKSTPCTQNISQDTTVFDTTQVDRKPEIISGPEIRYPRELVRQHISGRVILALVVSANGQPELRSIRVLKSDDYQFTSAAESYLRGAQFLPGCRQGSAVRVRVAVPIDFKIVR
jgi:TonB family protein